MDAGKSARVGPVVISQHATRQSVEKRIEVPLTGKTKSVSVRKQARNKALLPDILAVPAWRDSQGEVSDHRRVMLVSHPVETRVEFPCFVERVSAKRRLPRGAVFFAVINIGGEYEVMVLESCESVCRILKNQDIVIHCAELVRWAQKAHQGLHHPPILHRPVDKIGAPIGADSR